MFSNIVLWFYLQHVFTGVFVTLSVVTGLGTIAAWMYFAFIFDEKPRYYGYSPKNDDDPDNEEAQAYRARIKNTRKMSLALTISCILSVFISIAIPSREMIVAFNVAPQVDKYIKENPDTLISVDGAIGHTEKLVLSIFSTIEGVPGLLDAASKNLLRGVNESSEQIPSTD